MDSSDVHAEVGAIAECARQGIRLDGSCAYVTMPPCSQCYRLLVRAGVTRIVSPSLSQSAKVMQNAEELGVECVVVPDTKSRREQRDKLAKENTDMDLVRALRAERKQRNYLRKQAKRDGHSNGQNKEEEEGVVTEVTKRAADTRTKPKSKKRKKEKEEEQGSWDIAEWAREVAQDSDPFSWVGEMDAGSGVEALEME
eukprot:gb/GEZN01019988.1/.p1 GENE.gb/GEZN01019988.1/~~gb/GEZN01019988.1/.p1  ORF type:complete len:223 (+),score=54.88 gb/GEZN01019988.1/:76-669(+)